MTNVPTAGRQQALQRRARQALAGGVSSNTRPRLGRDHAVRQFQYGK